MYSADRLIERLTKEARKANHNLWEFQRISCGSMCCDIETCYTEAVIDALASAVVDLQIAEEDRTKAYADLDGDNKSEDAGQGIDDVLRELTECVAELEMVGVQS